MVIDISFYQIQWITLLYFSPRAILYNFCSFMVVLGFGVGVLDWVFEVEAIPDVIDILLLEHRFH